MAVNRKNSFEEQEQDLLNFPAFKHGEILSNDVANLVFNNDVALSVNLKDSFSMVLKWKQEKHDSLGTLHPDENYACKCLGPTEKEIKKARQKYWKGKQKKSSGENMEVENLIQKTPPHPMTSPVLPRKTWEKVDKPVEVQSQGKPEVKKANHSFTSARHECLRQAAVNNRAPPAGISSTAPSANNVRRYMGSRLVSFKPNTVTNKDPEMEMNKVLDNGEECEDERLKAIDPKLLDRLKIDVLAKPSSLSECILKFILKNISKCFLAHFIF